MTAATRRCACRRLAVAASLWTAVAVAAAEANWFAATDAREGTVPLVEVDLNSVGAPLAWPEAVLRVTFAQPHVHDDGFAYRSLKAVVRFDCEAETLEPVAVSYFGGPSAGGRLLAAESDLADAGISPLSARVLGGGTGRMLVKAACAVQRDARRSAGRCNTGRSHDQREGGQPLPPSVSGRTACGSP